MDHRHQIRPLLRLIASLLQPSPLPHSFCQHGCVLHAGVVELSSASTPPTAQYTFTHRALLPLDQPASSSHIASFKCHNFRRASPRSPISRGPYFVKDSGHTLSDGYDKQDAHVLHSSMRYSSFAPAIAPAKRSRASGSFSKQNHSFQVPSFLYIFLCSATRHPSSKFSLSSCRLARPGVFTLPANVFPFPSPSLPRICACLSQAPRWGKR